MHLVGGIGMGVLGWADHDDDCDVMVTIIKVMR